MTQRSRRYFAIKWANRFMNSLTDTIKNDDNLNRQFCNIMIEEMFVQTEIMTLDQMRDKYGSLLDHMPIPVSSDMSALKLLENSNLNQNVKVDKDSDDWKYEVIVK